jgi:hypothetical protein
MLQFSYLKRSSNQRRAFNSVQDQLVFTFPVGKFPVLAAWLRRTGSRILKLDVPGGFCLASLPQGLTSEIFREVNSSIPPVRSFPALGDEQGQATFTNPASVIVELSTPAQTLFPPGVEPERLTDKSFVLHLPSQLHPFELLSKLESEPNISIAEPDFISFDAAEASDAFEATMPALWGDLAYNRKTRGTVSKFTVVQDHFVVTLNPSSAESPTDALSSEGLETVRLDGSEQIAVVKPTVLREIVREASFRSVSLFLEGVLTTRAKTDDPESVVDEIFPVVLDENGRETFLRPLECLVGFNSQLNNEPITHAHIIDLLKGAGLSVLEELTPFVFRCRHTVAAAFFASLNQLTADPAVLFAEPVFVSFQPVDAAGGVAITDPDFTEQWNLKICQCESAWGVELGHPDVIVVVPDQGVDLNLTDLDVAFLDRNGQGWNFTDVGNKSPQEVIRQHGTMIAGIIGAQHNSLAIAGIAPGCLLMPLKMYSLSLSTSRFHQVLTYICDFAQSHTNQDFVVNMSFNVPDSEAVQQDIQRGDALGIVFVGSAGNNSSNQPHFPSDYPPVISVAATGPDDRFASSYSNFGPRIDLCAPGGMGVPQVDPQNIISLNSNNKLGWDFGTSFASPHAAAAAALLLSLAKRRGQALTPAQVRNALKSSADDLAAANPTLAGNIGAGRLNIFKALNSI